MKAVTVFFLGVAFCGVVVAAAGAQTSPPPNAKSKILEVRVERLEATIASLNEQVLDVSVRLNRLEGQLKPQVIPIAR